MHTLRIFILLVALLPASAIAQQAPREQRALQRGTDSTLSEREELAIAGLESLMSVPPERALPLLRKVLSGSMSDRVKSRAVFVLAQIDTPEAQSLLIETAQSSGGELQREAVRAIGIGGDQAALDSLAALYANGDEKLRQDILHAYMIADRKDAIFAIATNAKSEDELDEAIRMLGAMNAGEELRRLGELHQDSESLMQAYAVAGDLDSLRRIAAGQGEGAVRAVRSIGIIGTDAAREALRELYRTGAREEIKDAALQGLLIAGDEAGVLELYRASTDTGEKKALLRTLSLMDGDAALEAIDSALEGERP